MLVRVLLLAILVYLIVRGVRRLLATAPAAPSRPSTPRAERSAYEVLGVPANATTGEIRAAYQRLVRENHPDRVADMSPEIRELAERRTKEINAAYEKLRA